MPILSWEALNKILTDALRNYNELNAAMDLVIFFFFFIKLLIFVFIQDDIFVFIQNDFFV